MYLRIRYASFFHRRLTLATTLDACSTHIPATSNHLHARLLWWQKLKGVCNLLLPRQLRLSVDLSGWLEGFTLVPKQDSARDDLVIAHDGLMVVHMRGTVGAIVAVDVLA